MRQTRDTLTPDGTVSLASEPHPGLRACKDYEAMAEALGEEITRQLIERRDKHQWPAGIDGPLGPAQTCKQRIALLEHTTKHAMSARQVNLPLSGDSDVSLAVGGRNAARHWLDVCVFAQRAYLDALGLQDKRTLRELEEDAQRARDAAEDKIRQDAEAKMRARSDSQIFDPEVGATTQPGTGA